MSNDPGSPSTGGLSDVPPPPPGYGGSASAPAGVSSSAMPPPPPAYDTAPALPTSAAGLPPFPSGVALSTKGRRFWAYLLDILLLIVTLVIGWIIWDIILWGRGQSPAKQILKMQVVRADSGAAASWSEMLMRELVGKFLLSAIPFYTLVSAIFVLVDDRNQALWDKLASTLVVDDPSGSLRVAR